MSGCFEPTLGARIAPLPLPVPMVTGPLIIPLPPNVPPFTFTLAVPVPEPLVLLTTSVPALTVVPAVYRFAPVKVSVPLPIFVSAPLPWPTPPGAPGWSTPENVVLSPLLPTEKFCFPR